MGVLPVLPGTYIQVNAQGLIAPGAVSTGNVGVVGTAAKGLLGQVIGPLGSLTEAQQHFYSYDALIDLSNPAQPKVIPDALTLVRALEQAFVFGATTVYAVRVAGKTLAAASSTLMSTNTAPQGSPSNSHPSVTLSANSPGMWGQDLSVKVEGLLPTDDPAFIDEVHKGDEPKPIKLKHKPVQSSRNRVVVQIAATGITTTPTIVYDPPSGPPVTPGPGQVKIDLAKGELVFHAGEDPTQAGDTVTASYLVVRGEARKVTLQLGRSQEVYTMVDAKDLIEQINNPNTVSAWVTAALAKDGKSDDQLRVSPNLANFTGGDNGAVNADYISGLEVLLKADVQIVVAAGKDTAFGNELDKHCQKASTDTYKRERIAFVGSNTLADPKHPVADSTFPLAIRPDPDNTSNGTQSKLFDLTIGHNLDSDRVTLVAPGFQAIDAVSGLEITYPGAYTAAAVAGLIASLPPHFSPTNKILSVDELEQHYTTDQLTALVENRVLAVERRQGFHVVKGITTTKESAFAQITTRRIVDFAKGGVRIAADPYIGQLNNDRVRGALRNTINSFLADMTDAEMLTGYDLDVSATRAQEIQGIASVTMTLQPTFSIDYIMVIMILQ